MDSNYMPDTQRFSGFAGTYDRYRPGPPAALAEVLCRLAGGGRPRRVVDLGCGTGLSTRYWSGIAQEAIGIDPTADMLEQARRATPRPEISYRMGVSNATGLPDGCADIITCVQALHWMEPTGTFLEAKRILRDGGVFAAVDYDWPPHTLSWRVSQAYDSCMTRVLSYEAARRNSPQRWKKEDHLQRMKDSGCFRYATEMVLHHTEMGNSERIIGVLLSQGSVAGLLKLAVSEADLGIDVLRRVAAEELGDQPKQWYWTARVRIAVV